MARKRIIFVDDDPRILRGIERMMMFMDEEWEIGYVESGPEALENLARSPFDVVVSDMRMPGMDGAELLEEVSKRYPQMVRIILSGQSDQEMIMKSVGPTHQYLSKPFEGEKLQEILHRAFALRDLLGDNKLRALVSRLKSLPSLPTLYQQLMAEMQSPEVTMKQVGEIIAKDVAMTTKVLQLVNSSFFGLGVRISDPAHAARLLGPEILKALVLYVQVFSKFEKAKSGGLSIEKFSNHSLAVASLARKIALAQEQDKKMADDAFIAGMLHDIGKLLLASSLPDEFTKIIALAHEKDIPSWQAEQEMIGGSHAEVGAYLLGLWGLPDSVVEAVAFHHKPARCIDQSFSALTGVHVANCLESELCTGNKCGSEKTVDLDYLEMLGLVDKLQKWREHAKELNNNKVLKNERKNTLC